MTPAKGRGSVGRRQYIGRIQNRANNLPVDLTRITNALNKALSTAEALLEDADKLIKLKAIHALSQTSAALLKVLEVGEMEARVADLEAAELERSDAEQESE